MIERPNYVRVINGNKEKVIGRFDGQDFEFLPGKHVDIPVVVATHIFGFGRPDKLSALNRLGWLQSSEHLEKAMAKLNRVSFTESPPLVDAEMPDPEDDSASDLLPTSDRTAPPVSPEVSGGGGTTGQRLALPKPPRG